MSSMSSTGTLQAKRNRELNSPLGNERDESSSSGNRVGGPRFASPNRIESKYTEPERTSSSSFKPPMTRDTLKKPKPPDSPERNASSLSSALSFFKNVFTSRGSQPPSNINSDMSGATKPLTIKVLEKTDSAKKDKLIAEKIEITTKQPDQDFESKKEISEEIDNRPTTPNPHLVNGETADMETKVEKPPRRKPNVPFSFDPKKIRPNKSIKNSKGADKTQQYLPPTMLPSLPSDGPVDSQWEARMKKIEQFRRRHLVLPPTIIESNSLQSTTSQVNPVDSQQQGYIFPPREIKPTMTSPSPVRSHKVEPANKRWRWNHDENKDHNKAFGKRYSQPKTRSKQSSQSPKRSSQKISTSKGVKAPLDDYTRPLVQKSESGGTTTYKAISSPTELLRSSQQRSPVPVLTTSRERLPIRHGSPKQNKDYRLRKKSPSFHDESSKKSRIRSKSTPDKMYPTSRSEHTTTGWRSTKRAKSIAHSAKTGSPNALIDDRDIPMIYPNMKQRRNNKMQRPKASSSRSSMSNRRISSRSSSRKSMSNELQSSYSVRRSLSREKYRPSSPGQSPSLNKFKSPRSSPVPQRRRRSPSAERQPSLTRQRSPPGERRSVSPRPRPSSPPSQRRSFSNHRQSPKTGRRSPSPASARLSHSPRPSSSARQSFSSHQQSPRVVGRSSSPAPLSPGSARRSMSTQQSPSSYQHSPGHRESRKSSPWQSKNQSHQTKPSSKSMHPYRQANAKDRIGMQKYPGNSKRGSPLHAHKTQSQGDFQSRVKMSNDFGMKSGYEDGRSKQRSTKTITPFNSQYSNRPQASSSYSHHSNKPQGMSTWALKNQHPPKNQPQSNLATKGHRSSKQQQSHSGKGGPKYQQYHRQPGQISPWRQNVSRHTIQSPIVNRDHYQTKLQPPRQVSDVQSQAAQSPIISSLEPPDTVFPPKSPSLLRSSERISPSRSTSHLDDEPDLNPTILPSQISPSVIGSDHGIRRSPSIRIGSPMENGTEKNPSHSSMDRLESMSVSPIALEALGYTSPTMKQESPEISYTTGNYNEVWVGNEDFTCYPGDYASDDFQGETSSDSYGHNLNLQGSTSPAKVMVSTSNANMTDVLISSMIPSSQSATNANNPEQDKSNSASSYLAHCGAYASAGIHWDTSIIDHFKDNELEAINCSNSSLYNPPTRKDDSRHLYRGMLQDTMLFESEEMDEKIQHRDSFNPSIAQMKALQSEQAKNLQKATKDAGKSQGKYANPGQPQPGIIVQVTPPNQSIKVTPPVTMTRVHGTQLSPQKESKKNNETTTSRVKGSGSSLPNSKGLTSSQFPNARFIGRKKDKECTDCVPVKGNDSQFVQKLPQNHIPAGFKSLKETTPRASSNSRRRSKKYSDTLHKMVQLRSPSTENSPLQFRKGSGKVPVQKPLVWRRPTAASATGALIGSGAKSTAEHAGVGMASGQRNSSSPKLESDAETQISPSAVMKKTISFFSSFFNGKENAQAEPEVQNEDIKITKDEKIIAKTVYFENGVPQSTFHKSLTMDRLKSPWLVPKEEIAPKNSKTLATSSKVLANSSNRGSDTTNVKAPSPGNSGSLSSRRPGDFGSSATMLGEIP